MEFGGDVIVLSVSTKLGITALGSGSGSASNPRILACFPLSGPQFLGRILTCTMRSIWSQSSSCLN